MKFCLILVCVLIYQSGAARILCIFPTPSVSHQVAFRPLTLELARRGHELVVLTTDPVYPKGKAPENYTEIDVHDISYEKWNNAFVKERPESLMEQNVVIFRVVNEAFVEQVMSSDFQELLKSEKKFDLLIIESFVRPAWALGNVFKAPVIIISSFGVLRDVYNIFGASTDPILYPPLTRGKLNNLTLWDKLNEMYHNYLIEESWKVVDKHDKETIKLLFGPNAPSSGEIADNVDLLIVNMHPIWDSNRPVAPNVVFAGGMHQKPAKELPLDLKNFLDSSKHGVIYISFGTNVIPSLLPPEWIQMLVNVFSQLPYDVLWKWDKDEMPGKSDNIRIFKWLPQSDLLRHPKVKLFITQGGLQSSDEAITAGVPLIGIPMLGDQWYNAEQYVKHKIGLRLDVDEVTEEKFKSAIEEIIGGESYRQNIARLRDEMYDQPQSSLERAVWWTEHVLRHGGGKHLRPAGANISWSQYLELPFVLTLLAIVVTIFSILISIVVCIWRHFRSYSSIKLKKT